MSLSSSTALPNPRRLYRFFLCRFQCRVGTGQQWKLFLFGVQSVFFFSCAFANASNVSTSFLFCSSSSLAWVFMPSMFLTASATAPEYLASGGSAGEALGKIHNRFMHFFENMPADADAQAETNHSRKPRSAEMYRATFLPTL